MALAIITVSTAFSFTPAARAAVLDPYALFAREHEAVGGRAWNSVAAVQTFGAVVAGGGEPSAYFRTIDHKNGWSKTIEQNGAARAVSGYDGVGWILHNAITEQTLPGVRADNVTQAYVARDGWWNRDDPADMRMLGMQNNEIGVRVTPHGGSAIDVWLDGRNDLIDKLLAHTEYGSVRTAFEDYRRVGDLLMSFRSVTTDGAGGVMTTTLDTAMPLATTPDAAFARPDAVSDGSIASGAVGVAGFRLSSALDIIFDVGFAHGSLPFSFDTGGENYITPAGAKQLALRAAGGLLVEGAGNGIVNASVAPVGTISLGAVNWSTQTFKVGALPYALSHEARNIDVYGLVGPELLQSFRVSLDFVERRATFTTFATPVAPMPRAVAMPMLSDGTRPYVRAQLDGVSGIFLLDSGNDGNVIVFPWFLAEHHVPHAVGLHYVAVGGLGGSVGYREYRIASFTLGGTTMHHLTIAVPDSEGTVFASHTVAGNIGVGVLSRYDVTFDYSRQTVTFMPNANVDASFPANRTGATFDQTDGSTFVVLSVLPGSPAASARLHVGDRIVAVNGRSIARARLGLDDIAPLARGTLAFTLTVRAGNGRTTILMIRPRDLLRRS